MQLKNKKAAKGDDEGEWIMSYADTVTLLLCFFVIFFSEAKVDLTVDTEEVVEMASEIPQVLDLEEQIREKAELERLSKLRSELNARLKKESLQDFELIQDERDISIRLSQKGFFELGAFKLLPEGKNKLEKIALSLKAMQEDLEVTVEGHTDSKPVGSSAFYSSNIGLSSLRAASAAEVIIGKGFDPKKVKVLGYGDAKPVVVDRMISSEDQSTVYLEEKAKLNRRIEIKLMSHNKAKN